MSSGSTASRSPSVAAASEAMRNRTGRSRTLRRFGRGLDPHRRGQNLPMSEHMWTFGDIAPEGSEHADIDGFTVVAGDDEVGRVVHATFEPGSSCVVVETGLRLVGRRVLVPA